LEKITHSRGNISKCYLGENMKSGKRKRGQCERKGKRGMMK
jgi:hypothetical protein